MQKGSFSRFRELKNSNHKNLRRSLKKKRKEKKSRDIKLRRYIIELDEFEKEFILFKDIDDSVENEKKEILFEKVQINERFLKSVSQHLKK